MVAGACVWGTGTSLVPLFAEQPGALWVIFGLSSLIGAIPVGVMISLSAEVMRPQVLALGRVCSTPGFTVCSSGSSICRLCH